MDSQEQQKPQTASVSNPYLLRLKCFLCQALNPNVNDENNNLKKANSNANESSFNPISKLPLYTCPDCEAKIRLEEKETSSSSTVTSQNYDGESDRMIIVPDTSSDEDEDDECWCQSCVPLIDEERDSKYRELWDHLSHVVKCLYRATDEDFSENQLSNDISKVKRYVKRLTKVNPQSLFNKLESIVLEYVREIRKQVLERFHTCSKTSHDVQLFISFLLDEYQMFIQSATNVSAIVSYLEENYMKSFHLTWLLYNKHLYEELIYMDRKIHHSMTTMIDLLQPSNDDDNSHNDYSPAEYTQLLNRFLAFDEEMSEIACLYKDSQAKMISKSFDVSLQNGYPLDINMKSAKKKQCKKLQRSKELPTATDENTNSSTTTAVDIPSSNNSSSTPVPDEQGSNGSSVGSGIAGDEFSSASSIDDHLLDNDTSSSGYTQEEQEELARLIFNDDDMNEYLLQEILNSVSPYARIQHQIEQTRSNENKKKVNSTTIDDNDDWIRRIIHGEPTIADIEPRTTNNERSTTIHSLDNLQEEATNIFASSASSPNKSSSNKSKSNKSSSSSSRRRKETALATNPTTTTSQIPKKSIAADLLLPRSIADLSAKIQSVSFTAGTFGSITSTNVNDYHHSLSSSSSSSSSSSAASSSNCSTTTLTAAKTTTATGQTRLSINLTRKPGFKPTEHGGQKIAEALFNELTSLGNGEPSTRETLNSGRKKDNQQFKKNKQQRSTTTTTSTINETILNSTNSNNSHPFLSSSTKSDSNSSSMAYNNLDHLLRHAASNADVSEAALHSILSSFHSPTCLDAVSSSSSSSSSSSKHSISSKTTEALQALIAQQQQQQHHHHHQKKTLLNNHKRCEFCCCEFSEGRTCAASTCLHLPTTPTTNNGALASCVTCMALPGATSTTTSSVIGTTITGAFNQRDIEMKERLKLKLTKRTVQNLTEQQTSAKDQQQKSQQKKSSTAKTTEQKITAEKNSKAKEFPINDKNNIDDLVRFIDGDETMSSNNHEHQTQTTTTTTTTTTNESTSKKNKKKKDKQTKINVNQQDNKSSSSQVKEQPTTTRSQEKQNQSNTTQQIASSEQTSRSASSSSTSSKIISTPSKTSPNQSQQTLSKRQQKAKLKLEQQQKETPNNVEDSSIPCKSTVTTMTPKNVSSASITVPPSNSSSQGTLITRANVPFSSDTFDSPEEEINWITISRKQGKHKPTPPSVPSLLATPVLPVVPPQNTKPQRQQQQPTATNTKKTTSVVNVSSLAQQKVITPITPTSNLTSNVSISTMNKQQQPTIAGSVRSQNALKNPMSHQVQNVESSLTTQPPSNLWKNNPIHEQASVISPVTASSVLTSSTLLATTPSYVPTHSMSSSSLLSPITIGNNSSIPPSSSILSEDLTSSIAWDSNGYLLAAAPQPLQPPISLQSSLISSIAPGPVQRPHSSFSPAPGTMNNTTSRCIQRPSPEPRSSSNTTSPFSLYFPMNYSGTNTTSAWNESMVRNSHEPQWNYPQEQQQQQQFGLSTDSNDFPLYDPFHSGAGLTIPSSTQTTLLTNGFAEHLTDLCVIPQDNDINDMDALDKEIEDFKKFCFEQVPLETREKVQVNIDRCFVRQA